MLLGHHKAHCALLTHHEAVAVGRMLTHLHAAEASAVLVHHMMEAVCVNSGGMIHCEVQAGEAGEAVLLCEAAVFRSILRHSHKPLPQLHHL